MYLHSCDKGEQLNCTSLSEILEGLSEQVRESHMRFLVRRECVLEDTLRTVQWPNFCVYDRVVVSLSIVCGAYYMDTVYGWFEGIYPLFSLKVCSL